ncbi:hypothetical protein OIV83_004161 [Microbotryomycetes sp. JL201]|nr:hypothetical protein OIV83_004161 [Microbotryomycetes sp. JL201]
MSAGVPNAHNRSGRDVAAGSEPAASIEMALQCSQLMPQLVQLVHASALAQNGDSAQAGNASTSAVGQSATPGDDAEARASKLELARLATHLRSDLASLKTRAQQIPAGHLSLQDQTWLIAQLHETLQDKKRQVQQLKELIPASLDGRTDVIKSDDVVMQVD